MSLLQLRRHSQITMPARIRKDLRLKEGDYLEAEVEDGVILLRPKELIDKDQAWFWTKEWQEGEREADEDIKTGRVAGPFNTAAELLKDLKS
ncbi:AbrB/MazE/SpoVT family DNA-binding domain-containing protein [bacterium]|nr:AbrB/MazE/SpoVT family DNA-binding domain-containing protein [bacterium]MBU1614771.1 AbrB/MazE/SpoVT family DNA-binding domain-containing protein [bacterium]